jgi:hypothetical protein
MLDEAAPQFHRITASSLIHHPLRNPSTSCRSALKVINPEDCNFIICRNIGKGFSILRVVYAKAVVSSVRVRVTLRLAVYRESVRLGAKPLETHDQYFFQLNTCSYSPYVTSSLTREWVCHLHLVLAFASAVFLESESRGTHDHILLSQIRDSPNLEGQVPVFISLRNMLVLVT